MLTDITKGLPVSRGKEILPAIHDGELRILDTDLATRLDFDRPRDIRKLIKRYEAELCRMGRCATVARRPETGGHTVIEHYLNEEQALFITAKSETAAATKITIEIVTQFAAFKRGEVSAPQLAIPSHAEALRMAADHLEEIARQKALIDAVAPKVAALDELAGMDGFFGLREAAKECGWPEGKFIQRLHEMRWIFKQEPNRPWQAHADKLRGGLLAHKTYEQTKPNGEVSLRYQVVVTAKGLARLAVRLGSTPDGKRAVPFAKKPEPAS